MTIIYTNGLAIVNIASDKIDYKVDDTIAIRGSISKAGYATLQITSPEGWLYYDELNGVHTWWIGEDPYINNEEE